MKRPPKDFPIIFSRPMIHALLIGRKHMTRRFLYHWHKVPETGISPGFKHHREWQPPNEFRFGYAPTLTNWHDIQPGDRIWTRENWRPDITNPADADRTIYQADVPYGVLEETRGTIKWRPSIHQERRRSRITILVDAVKIERCCDITNADAKAEGIRMLTRADDSHRMRPLNPGLPPNRYTIDMGDGFGYDAPNPRAAFCRLWSALNGPETWEYPVIAISGEVRLLNIDRLAA